MKGMFRPLLAAVVLPFLPNSCIEFTRQSLSYRHDAPKDQLLVFLAYDGVYGTSGGTSLDDAETGQLRSVMDGERAFFFSNWIFEFSRADLEEAVEDAKASQEPLTPGEQATVELCRTALDCVKVVNGPLYIGTGDRLCGCQYLTVNGLSRLVGAANESINAHVRETAIDELQGNPLPSAASAEAWKDAAGRDHEWIRADGNRITVRIPLTYGDYVEGRKRIVGDMMSAFQGEDATLESAWQTMRPWLEGMASGAVYLYEDGCLEVRLGHPGERITTLTMTVTDSYHANAVEHVRETYGLSENVDLERLRDDFFSTGRPPEVPAQSVPPASAQE